MFFMAERAVILSPSDLRPFGDASPDIADISHGEIPSYVSHDAPPWKNEVQSIHNVFYFAGKVMLSIPSWACLRKVNPSYVNSSVEVVITP